MSCHFCSHEQRSKSRYSGNATARQSEMSRTLARELGVLEAFHPEDLTSQPCGFEFPTVVVTARAAFTTARDGF